MGYVQFAMFSSEEMHFDKRGLHLALCGCVCERERETVCVNKITFPNFIKTDDGLFEAADMSLFLLQTFLVIYKHQQTTWSSTHSF